MSEPILPQKSIVSVVELSRTLGLSRSRFYQLVASGVFPAPKRNEATKRPFYDVEGQQTCQEVRRRNCGVNGQPILFYSRRPPAPILPKRRTLSAQSSSSARKKKTPLPAPTSPSSKSQTDDLAEGLRQLGLNDLSKEKVAAAVHACFPQGVGSTPEQEVLLVVFRYLVRQNSGENVGR